MKRELNDTSSEISHSNINYPNNIQNFSSDSHYCKIHDEEIKWICFYKHSNTENFCENYLLCIYCRKEHENSHLNNIESIDFLKTDYLKKIIKKESE